MKGTTPLLIALSVVAIAVLPKDRYREAPGVPARLPQNMRIQLPEQVLAAASGNGGKLVLVVLPPCGSCSLSSRHLRSRIDSMAKGAIVLMPSTPGEADAWMHEVADKATAAIWEPWPAGIPGLLRHYAPSRIVISANGELVDEEHF